MKGENNLNNWFNLTWPNLIIISTCNGYFKIISKTLCFLLVVSLEILCVFFLFTYLFFGCAGSTLLRVGFL